MRSLVATPGTVIVRDPKGRKPCGNCDCAAMDHKRRRTPEGWRERQECTTPGCGCRQYEAREQQPEERRCKVCQEMRRVVGKVGPLLIKEPCPFKCAAGYMKPKTKEVRP